MSTTPNLPPLSRARSHRSIFREDFDSQHTLPLPSFDIDPSSDMTTSSPTPRDIRRLASDHDFVFGAHPTPRRLGWWPFVATHLSIPAALGAGIIFVVVAIAYTAQLSGQVLECPAWATDGCRVMDGWTGENLGVVQGIITMVYLVGMVALGYTALGLCETTVWPLLHKQAFTIRGLNAFLSMTRGSVMAASVAVMAVRTVAAGFVLASALVVSLLPFAGPPLVGQAYTPTWRAVQLESNYTPGGGIAELYAQTNPPSSVLVSMLAEYDSWATDPSSEPMPSYRDWYMDREALSERGDFTAKAVRLRTSVSCRPHRVRQLNKDNLWWNAFLTSNNSTGNKNGSAEVWIRPHPQLTLWADDFEFVSDRRTRTTLVFAALNGTIEGGSVTPLALGNITSASAIACDVEVEAADDILSVGTNPPSPSDTTALPVLSSIETLALGPAAPQQTRLNELLRWFTVAPLLASTSVDGTQPMFTNSTLTGLPVAHTASSSQSPNSWTTEGLETFIRLSIGALAQATTNTSPPSSPDMDMNPSPTPVTLTSRLQTLTLSRPRTLLLLIPPLITLSLALILAMYTTHLHRTLSLPVLRQADLAELLKSSQTAWLRDVAGTDAAKAYLPSELGGVGVRYGVDGGGVAGFVEGGGNKGKGGGFGGLTEKGKGKVRRVEEV